MSHFISNMVLANTDFDGGGLWGGKPIIIGKEATLQWNGFAGVAKWESGESVTIIRKLKTRYEVRKVMSGEVLRVRPDQLRMK